MTSEGTANYGFQQPLFASASQQSQGYQLGEDIDLNEIFADYFISEFDDPLNAYTNSMANYNGAAAAVALAQKQQQVNAAMEASTNNSHTNTASTTTPTQAQQHNSGSIFPATHLPTGGIKTAFHTATTARIAAPPTNSNLSGNGMEPYPKKVKVEPNQQQQQQYPVPPTIHPGAIIGKGAISGRLGFAMVGGQLALPHQQQQNPQQQQQQQPQQQQPQQQQPQNPQEQQHLQQSQQQQQNPQLQQPQQQQVVLAAPPGNVVMMKQPAMASGVTLPVGVGIRLGGIGGVAPQAMHHHAQQQQQHFLWAGPPGLNPSGGIMSEAAVAERRQRNREHAKRSRVRKKFMLESLQEQVRGLQKENVELRMIIQEKIPAHAQQILSECCTKNTLFADSAENTTPPTPGADPTSLARSDFTLMESLTSGQQNFVLSDPRLPDNPIVYASPGFYVLTGYTQDQVLGRNCRFLQGPGTDPRHVDIIRKAIANGSDATTCILNYKADGSPFWNQFFVAALRDSDNCIVNYVGVQCEVEPESTSTALEDKVNSVLPLQAKDGDDDDDDDMN